MGNGVFADSLATLNAQNLIDSYLAGGTKSGYDFALCDVSGVGPTAQFGATAVPSITSGFAQTGTRRFAITNIGVMRGDPVLTAPTTVAAIDAISPLGN